MANNNLSLTTNNVQAQYARRTSPNELVTQRCLRGTRIPQPQSVITVACNDAARTR